MIRTNPITLRYRSDASLGSEARYFTEEGAPVGGVRTRGVGWIVLSSALAEVRDKAALDQLPEAERDAWRQL